MNHDPSAAEGDAVKDRYAFRHQPFQAMTDHLPWEGRPRYMFQGDPVRMDQRHWANLDTGHIKDMFRDHAVKLMEVLAERDAAIAERDTAIAEKKTAYAERDAALLQRDVAYADRNSALMERDTAIAALTMIRANKDNVETATKLMQMITVPLNAAPLDQMSPLAMPDCGLANLNVMKRPQVKKVQEGPKKRKRSIGEPSQQQNKVMKSPSKEIQQQMTTDEQYRIEKPKEEDLQKPNCMAIDPYDVLSAPIPYCSCTGTNQQCYRWGKGGWQSACCTNVLSVYPLPMSQTKRGARVPGRKMSGGAFKKVLEKLATAGVDISMPIDLKNHWAKHGTNRYVTIK